MGRVKRVFQKIWYIYILRNKIAYAKRLGVKIGEQCNILSNPLTCFGSEPWLIKIGNHVEITAGVQFLTHEGALWCVRGLKKEYQELDLFEPIIVGDNVMIGMGSMIMPGVTVGDNAIIAAHSVVTKDVKSGTIVAGVPAREISTLQEFVEKLKTKPVVKTKKMTIKEKRKYLYEKYPEWF